MKLILLTVALLGIAFAGIAVKILLKKNGEFAGTCSSNNPMLSDEGGSCTICGAKATERCQK